MTSRRLLLAVLVGLAGAGCARSGSTAAAAAGGATDPSAAQRQAVAAQTATPASAQADRTGAADAGHTAARETDAPETEHASPIPRSRVSAVAYEQLTPLLPAVDGWTQSHTTGEQLTTPATYSRAETRYRRGENQVVLEIIDTAENPLLLAPTSMFVADGYSERSDEGFWRAARIGGIPASERWNAPARHAEVTAIVKDRFIVHATGQPVGDPAAVRRIVEAVDLTRLSALH